MSDFTFIMCHSYQPRRLSYVTAANQLALNAIVAMLAEPAGEASPRDADRIMSGYWGVVAIWVTHPLWPFRVPLTVICSVILARFGGAF